MAQCGASSPVVAGQLSGACLDLLVPPDGPNMAVFPANVTNLEAGASHVLPIRRQGGIRGAPAQLSGGQERRASLSPGGGPEKTVATLGVTALWLLPRAESPCSRGRGR